MTQLCTDLRLACAVTKPSGVVCATGTARSDFVQVQRGQIKERFSGAEFEMEHIGHSGTFDEVPQLAAEWVQQMWLA